MCPIGYLEQRDRVYLLTRNVQPKENAFCNPQHVKVQSLLTEIAGFTKAIKVRLEEPIEPQEIGSGKSISPQSTDFILVGRPGRTEIVVPESLIEILRREPFPDVSFGRPNGNIAFPQPLLLGMAGAA